MPPPTSALSLAGGIGAAADRPPSADGTNPLEATPMTTPSTFAAPLPQEPSSCWPQPAVSQRPAGAPRPATRQAPRRTTHRPADRCPSPGYALPMAVPTGPPHPAPSCTYVGATAPPPAWSTTAARLLVDASSICSHNSSVSSGPSPPGCSVASKFATEQHRSRPFVGQHR